MTMITQRLVEVLNPKENKHRLLMLIDEFPRLGKLPFFTDALAYLAGYNIKVMLVMQSKAQLDAPDAHGVGNTVIESCKVRSVYTPQDPVTAQWISDALGPKTEVHQQTTYTGHRLAPWLGHVMVADQESSRPLSGRGGNLQAACGRYDPARGRLPADSGAALSVLRAPGVRRAGELAAAQAQTGRTVSLSAASASESVGLKAADRAASGSRRTAGHPPRLRRRSRISRHPCRTEVSDRGSRSHWPSENLNPGNWQRLYPWTPRRGSRRRSRSSSICSSRTRSSCAAARSMNSSA